MLQNLTVRIVKFWSYWDLCPCLWETSREPETSAQGSRRLRVQLRPLCKLSGRLGAIFSQQWFLGFHNHKAFCYIHKISNLIIWHVLSNSLHIHTYRDTGMTEMDSATESIHLRKPGVDRRHHIIRNTYCIFPSPWSHTLLPSFHGSTQLVWFLTHSCQAFWDSLNVCGVSWPCKHSYPLTLSLRSPSQNHYVSRHPMDAIQGAAEYWWLAICLPAPAFHHIMIDWT